MIHFLLNQTIIHLLRRPTYFLTTVITLGLMMGSVICMAQLAILLMFKPLPYPNEDRLVFAGMTSEFGERKIKISSQHVPGLKVMYENSNVFSSFAMVFNDKYVLASHPEQPAVSAQAVTPEYFELLGTSFELGHAFLDKEGVIDESAVVILSYQTWKTWYQSSKEILGQKIQLGSKWLRVVGITAENFQPPEVNMQVPDVWIPWFYQTYPTKNWDVSTRDLYGIGLLAPQMYHQEAELKLTTSLNRAYEEQLKGSKSTTYFANLSPLRTKVQNQLIGMSVFMLIGTLLLLCLGSVNLLSLFRARWGEKQRDFAIHSVLGASMNMIRKWTLVEQLLLLIVASMLSFIVAGWGFQLLIHHGGGQIPRLGELKLDWITCLLTFILGFLLFIVFFMLTARPLKVSQLSQLVQTSGKGTQQQVSYQKQALLIFCQIFFSTLILVSAAFVFENALKKINSHLGIYAKGVYSVRLKGNEDTETVGSRYQVLKQIKKRLENSGQIQGVTFAMSSPISSSRTESSVRDLNGILIDNFRFDRVDKGYFDLVGQKIIYGRDFIAEDIMDQRAVIIVNVAFAKQVFQRENVIGESFATHGKDWKIVGVVSDVYNPSMDAGRMEPRMYIPFVAFEYALLVRVNDGIHFEKHKLLKILREDFSSFRILSLSEASEEYDRIIYSRKVVAAIAGSLIVITLLLAFIGIYGLLRYNINLRRYEIGVRMSLGATTQFLYYQILRETLWPIGLGVCVSLFAGGLLYLVVRLYIDIQISMLPLASILFLVVGVSIMGCVIPTRKAMLDDPVKLLRAD